MGPGDRARGMNNRERPLHSELLFSLEWKTCICKKSRSELDHSKCLRIYLFPWLCFYVRGRCHPSIHLIVESMYDILMSKEVIWQHTSLQLNWICKIQKGKHFFLIKEYVPLQDCRHLFLHKICYFITSYSQGPQVKSEIELCTVLLIFR